MGIVWLADEAAFTENANLFAYRIFGIVPLAFVRTSVFPEFRQFKVSAVSSAMPAISCLSVFHTFLSFLSFIIHNYFSSSPSALHYLALFISLFFPLALSLYLPRRWQHIFWNTFDQFQARDTKALLTYHPFDLTIDFVISD